MNHEVQIKAVINFAQSKLGDDVTGHGMDHLRRVAQLATHLAKEEGIDPFLPVTISYLHDIIDDKLIDDVEKAKADVKTFLQDQAYQPAEQAEIMATITQMSFASTLGGQHPQLSLAGQIAQDADWLDALGATGIIRAVYYGGKHHQIIYDPKIAPRTQITKAEYRNLDHETIINHFYEKLFKLATMLNTPSAKKIAQQREAFMHQFIDRFLAEWEGKA